MGRRPGELGQTPARAAALQAVVLELLDAWGGAPGPVVQQHLRTHLVRRGLPMPPEGWLQAVAGEIAADRVYVVANGSLPRDYAERASARRAAARVSSPSLALGRDPS